MITVGCAGFPVPATRYFKEFLFVEVQETHVAPPGSGTVRRWRREAPEGFRFAMVGPREIGQEGFRDGMVVETALKTLETVGKELSAETVVLVAPPDFPATRANKGAVKELLGIVRQRFARVVFDPASGWDPDETEAMAIDVGALAARDPLTAGISKRKEAYYRLPGPAGHKSRYEDPAIDRLGELARSVQDQDATYVFTNVDMFADAKRLKKVLKLLSIGKFWGESLGCATKRAWMGACSQCQSEVPAGAATCPRCGTAQVSAFDVPDLDLPAPPPAQPKAHARPKSSPAKLELGLDTSGQRAPSEPPAAFQQPSPPGLEDDDEMNTSGLELAAAPVRPASMRPAPAHAHRESPPRGTSSGRVSVPPPPGRRASLPPPAGAPSSPDLYEVQQVARFGPSPEFPWESVVYTLRVFSRLRELKQEIARATEEQRAQEKAADDAVVAFLDRAYAELIQDGSFARMFEPVQEMQARFLERQAEIDALDQEGQRELAAIDEELHQCERIAQEGRSTKEGLASEAARLYESSQAGDVLAGQFLGSIRAQMHKAEEEATQAVGLMNDLRRRRREVEQAYITRIREREEALAGSDGPRRAAMLEIGRGLLEGRTSLPHEGFHAVEIARKRTREVTHRRALLEAALTAYDLKKVKEGALYLAGALLLLLGGVILGILRMNQELSAPPPVLPPE